MKFETTIINELGMHAHAAIQFVQTANKYKSAIRISHNHKEADGKNLIMVLGLRIEKDDHITVVVEGEDEQMAFNDLKVLIDHNFGEE